MTPSKIGKTKNLIFYSLILAQIVEPFNSIKRRTCDCGVTILGHIVQCFVWLWCHYTWKNCRTFQLQYFFKLLNLSTIILFQIVEPFNSIKRRTYDCGIIMFWHVHICLRCHYTCTNCRTFQLYQTYDCNAIIIGHIRPIESFNSI